MSSYHLDHLQYLETEAIYVMREVAAEFERPVLLFSGGKDSVCLLRLAEKAFRPSDIPMPFLNIETGHEFPELIEFRDEIGLDLYTELIRARIDTAKEFLNTPDDAMLQIPGMTTERIGQIRDLLEREFQQADQALEDVAEKAGFKLTTLRPDLREGAGEDAAENADAKS